MLYVFRFYVTYADGKLSHDMKFVYDPVITQKLEANAEATFEASIRVGPKFSFSINGMGVEAYPYIELSLEANLKATASLDVGRRLQTTSNRRRRRRRRRSPPSPSLPPLWESCGTAACNQAVHVGDVAEP